MYFVREVVLAAVALMSFATHDLHAATYNATMQVSDKNPSGPWTYGSGVTGSTFTRYATYTNTFDGVAKVDAWYSGSTLPYVGVNRSGKPFDTQTAVAITGVLLMHPGPSSDSIVRWTAPVAGAYTFQGFYEILDADPTGISALIVDKKADITTTAFHGRNGVLTGPGANQSTFKPGGREKFSFSKAVAKGETISFGLNNDGDYYYDTTGVMIVVKGP